MTATAQMLPDYEFNAYTAIFEWQRNADKSWHKMTGHRIIRTGQAQGNIISFNENKRLLYLYDDNGIYKVELQPEWVAYIKKNYKAPNLSQNNLDDEIIRIENCLDSKFNGINENILKEKNRIEQKRINNRQKAIEVYKKEHPLWFKLPISEFHTKCMICNSKNCEDVYTIKGDTIFTIENKIDGLKEMIFYFHVHMLDSYDKSRLNLHFEAYKDSLTKHEFSLSKAVNFNIKEEQRHNEELNKKAPYGFVNDYGYNLNSANGVEPYFSFFNSSNKIIKYVDLYFSLYNDVDDKCYLLYDKTYIGKVRGTGPVNPFEKGTWAWDKATHYTSGDATKMKVVKIVVTYMDKSTKILSGKNLVINE